MMRVFMSFFFFFFNDTATTEIYPLSLHDALPISQARAVFRSGGGTARGAADRTALGARSALRPPRRGAIRGGPGVDAVVRPLQGRGSAGGGRVGGGGAVARRFRAVRGRAGGAVRDRRGGAAAAGRARGPRVGRHGLALRRTARPAELHAPTELSRIGRAGGIVERRARADRGVGRGGGPAGGARAAGPSFGGAFRTGVRGWASAERYARGGARPT